MADPPRNPDAGDNTGVRPDRESATGRPRWQKAVGIVGLVVVLLVVLFVVLQATGAISGDHAPGPPPGGHE